MSKRERKSRASRAVLPPEGLRLSPGQIDALIRGSNASDGTMPGEGEFILFAARKAAMRLGARLLHDEIKRDSTLGGELRHQVAFLAAMLDEMADDYLDRPILETETVMERPMRIPRWP